MSVSSSKIWDYGSLYQLTNFLLLDLQKFDSRDVTVSKHENKTRYNYKGKVILIWQKQKNKKNTERNKRPNR